MFYFWLAEKLGRTVKELLQSISSRELSEWKAYFVLMNEQLKKGTTEEPQVEDKMKHAFLGLNESVKAKKKRK